MKCSVKPDSLPINSCLLSDGVGFVCVHYILVYNVLFFLFIFACPGSVLEFSVLLLYLLGPGMVASGIESTNHSNYSNRDCYQNQIHSVLANRHHFQA